MPPADRIAFIFMWCLFGAAGGATVIVLRWEPPGIGPAALNAAFWALVALVAGVALWRRLGRG